MARTQTPVTAATVSRILAANGMRRWVAPKARYDARGYARQSVGTSGFQVWKNYAGEIEFTLHGYDMQEKFMAKAEQIMADAGYTTTRVAGSRFSLIITR